MARRHKRPLSSSLHVLVLPSFGSYTAAWDALVDEAPIPSPFLRSWWVENTIVGEPLILLAVDAGDGELVGGIALQRSRRSGIEIIEMAGSGGLEPDHLDLVARLDRLPWVAAAVGRWLEGSSSRILDLGGLVDDSYIASVAPGRGSVVDQEVAPFVRLPETWDEYLASRHGKLRSTISRTARRLEREGVTFAVVDGSDEAAVDAALADLRRLHDGRWGGESGFLDDWVRFTAAVRAGSKAGEVRFHQLVQPDGTVIAIEVEFCVANRMSFYQAGRLTDHEWRGAGSVLKARIIESAIAEGFVEFDLLRGGEDYKTEWADGSRGLHRLRRGVGRRGSMALRLAGVRRRAIERGR